MHGRPRVKWSKIQAMGRPEAEFHFVPPKFVLRREMFYPKNL